MVVIEVPRRLLPALVVAWFVLLAPAGWGARGDTELISSPLREASFVSSIEDFSGDPSVSADGRFVAFTSAADYFSADDNNRPWNVFVRDRATGATELISRASGFAGAAANRYSAHPSISADGRYVAFTSDAGNLSPDDNDRPYNVFVRDRVRGKTLLVSRARGRGGGGDGWSLYPSISADGRHVAFESEAENLSGDDKPDVRDVFVRDLATGATELVSRAPGPGGSGADSDSSAPSISADGRYVAFESWADNLSTEDNERVVDVFVRDRVSGNTVLVSRAPGPAGKGADGRSRHASISHDGRYVAFASNADNLSTEASHDVRGVFVRDLVSGETELVSRAAGLTGRAADAGSRGPSISADGRYVAFESWADNLSSEDDSKVTDIFVRDRVGANTVLVSRAAGVGGAGADADSAGASVSANGRYVAFGSLARNLSKQNNDRRASDVFLRDVFGGPPSVRAFSVSNRVFALKPDRRPATSFRYTATRAGTARLEITRLPGRGRVGVLQRRAHRGRNRLRFTGRVRGRTLGPGRYSATLTVVDAHGTAPTRTCCASVSQAGERAQRRGATLGGGVGGCSVGQALVRESETQW